MFISSAGRKSTQSQFADDTRLPDVESKVSFIQVHAVNSMTNRSSNRMLFRPQKKMRQRQCHQQCPTCFYSIHNKSTIERILSFAENSAGVYLSVQVPIPAN